MHDHEHEEGEEAHDHEEHDHDAAAGAHEEHDQDDHAEEAHDHDHKETAISEEGKEITAVLVKFRSKMGIVTWPRIIAQIPKCRRHRRPLK